ncbi:MAG: histidine--tRNA ligase [Candidatus Kapaibacterium sp.]|nr:MAG: histidine--tRNA ligase [Candidatus Kapabacteria bacterium]
MPTNERIQTVRGTKDILPSEIERWHHIESVIQQWMERYGYSEIRTPIIESAELFYRGVGEATDAVGKEMYVFPDRGGELLALRPELTAPVARAVQQHGLAVHAPLLRLWYYGPCFRYERPQKGRQRQFHQVGAECLGATAPDADVEIISLAWDILTSLADRTSLQLVLNTLGTAEEQQRYRALFVEYLERYRNELSPVSRERLQSNPLRILDSKDSGDRQLLANAPKIDQVLGPASRAHYDIVRMLLADAGIPYAEDPYLVRGLDYYTHTVFEFRSTRLGAQDAVGGGGRYDNLVAQVGGDPMPGVGFGIGIERLLLAMDVPTSSEQPWNLVVFIAAPSSTRLWVQRIAQWVRHTCGIACVTDLQFRSLKAQLRTAHRQRYSLCVILDEPIVSEGRCIVKDMRSGEQSEVPLDQATICEHIRALLATA